MKLLAYLCGFFSLANIIWYLSNNAINFDNRLLEISYGIINLISLLYLIFYFYLKKQQKKL